MKQEYNEKYDCYYDVDTDTWLEPKCVDSNCELCCERPEKPSQCEQN